MLAVADHGSLSAAARALGQSQPTIGRHVRALEAQLGLELFKRVPRGLEPTPAAAGIISSARQMAEAAAQLELAAAGQSEDLSGTVRLTASVVMSHFVLHHDLVQIDITNNTVQELQMNGNVFDINRAQGDTQGLFLEQFDDNGQGKLTGSVSRNVLRGKFLTGIAAIKTVGLDCSNNMIIPTRGGTPQGSGHETIKLGANAGSTATKNVAGELHHLADEPNSLPTKGWTQSQWEAAFPMINMDPAKVSTKQEVLGMCRHVNGLYGPHA